MPTSGAFCPARQTRERVGRLLARPGPLLFARSGAARRGKDVGHRGVKVGAKKRKRPWRSGPPHSSRGSGPFLTRGPNLPSALVYPGQSFIALAGGRAGGVRGEGRPSWLWHRKREPVYRTEVGRASEPRVAAESEKLGAVGNEIEDVNGHYSTAEGY